MDLENYRKEIDQIDKNLLELLAKRFEVVKKIGEYKKKHNISSLQPNRWQEVILSKKQIAKQLGIKEQFVEIIWNEIHKYALDLEDN